MRLQTLTEALEAAQSGADAGLARAAEHLNGILAGNAEALRGPLALVVEYLPPAAERAYTVHEFISGAYRVVDGRYRSALWGAGGA